MTVLINLLARHKIDRLTVFYVPHDDYYNTDNIFFFLLTAALLLFQRQRVVQETATRK